MGAMAAPITSLTIVCSIVYSGADQRKHHRSAPLAFVRGIHRWPVSSPHKEPVTRRCFNLMTSSRKRLIVDEWALNRPWQYETVAILIIKISIQVFSNNFNQIWIRHTLHMRYVISITGLHLSKCCPRFYGTRIWKWKSYCMSETKFTWKQYCELFLISINPFQANFAKRLMETWCILSAWKRNIHHLWGLIFHHLGQLSLTKNTWYSKV